MADVTGPISTLPGARRSPPEGTMCDMHPDRPAIVRLQGETDSFGCEMHDLCTECLEEEKKVEPDVGECDWCHSKNVVLRPRRDIDEGLHGPVYYVCIECVKKDEAAIQQEVDQYDNGGYYDED